ncbi:MAG: sel1 repeat family protein [Roseitalea sp.]|jgi:TPR repeat protein|uniref:Sel1 repeat family protein n=1 Tax=Oceaniradius stylonematis TaxID=2184161 RepID=A0A3A8AEK3_9HYPH|nr:tetratricopeptide repeat protein [Oceaniradius stylonematis]MBO6552539.1 sel1 repeat family protein [Roseitalea sp.]MBO6950541.1 sel1 repeat family protein [Rhizobiaceae bacterium]RNC94948.1 MAG: sel1 repeat family protein [Oricola sp.]MBO6591472.1 sel1 repeat family protein [Roseitalea sp.]MBO6599327.1 sel1 repeat family protein [Roseitalea sp.]
MSQFAFKEWLGGVLALGLATCVAAAAVPAAHAFDEQGGVSSAPAHNSIRSLFRFGFTAYQSGNKDEAFRAYRDAAEQGHSGARWKLAHMYAAGDGVAENDYEAFKLFQGIVREGAAPGSQESTFVANALVSLASYVQRGIPNSPVVANPAQARELYWQAAANFGEPNAQFELGRMLLYGEGGHADPRQAARWFNLSAGKGHVGAQAMLGQMLFERGQTVRGLSMLTAALNRAGPQDRVWIRPVHEEAFALSSEADRRTAMVLAEEMASR